MRPIAEVDARRVIDLMRGYLASRAMPCAFARPFGKDGKRLLWSAFDGAPNSETPLLLAEHMTIAGATRELAGIVFPEMSTPQAVCDLLEVIHGNAGWRITLPEVPNLRKDVVAVGVEWATEHAQISRVMGLGPIGTMPEHRRAPCVSLVAWTGPHENEREPKREKFASLLGMSVASADSDYAEIRSRTRAQSDELRLAPFGVGAHHTVAFTLSAEMLTRLKSFAGK